jgi:hypothetical protein
VWSIVHAVVTYRNRAWLRSMLARPDEIGKHFAQWCAQVAAKKKDDVAMAMLMEEITGRRPCSPIPTPHIRKHCRHPAQPVPQVRKAKINIYDEF